MFSSLPDEDIWHNSTTPDIPEENEDEKDLTDDEIEKKGWLLWVQIGCLILAILGVLAKLFRKCQECCPTSHQPRSGCCQWRGCCRRRSLDEEAAEFGADLIICYLCNKKVEKAEWAKLETGHRSYCAVKSKEHRGT